MFETIDNDTLGDVTGGASSSSSMMMLAAAMMMRGGRFKLDADGKKKLIDMFIKMNAPKAGGGDGAKASK